MLCFHTKSIAALNSKDISDSPNGGNINATVQKKTNQAAPPSFPLRKKETDLIGINARLNFVHGFLKCANKPGEEGFESIFFLKKANNDKFTCAP